MDVWNKDEVVSRMKAVVASKKFVQEDILCRLVADACIQVSLKNPVNFNVDNVHVIKLLGGDLHNCSIICGMVLKTDAVGSIKQMENAKRYKAYSHDTIVLAGADMEVEALKIGLPRFQCCWEITKAMDREEGEAKAREVARRGGDAKYHVLLVAFASQGHINPMLKLGKRLASKGLHVTLATTETARRRMVKANITTTATNLNNPIHLEFFSDGLPIDFDRLNKMDHFFDQLEQHGPTNLSNLIESLSNCNGSKFSCIINNPFVPWVADVAQDHGIPCAMLWIQPCALYAIYYRYYNGLNQFPTITDPNMPVDLPGLPILCKEDLPSFVLPSNTFSSVPKTLTHLFGNMDKVKWVLGNSFYELEKDAVESMDKIQPIIPVGPLVPSMLLGEEDATDAGIDMWKADDSCIEWLDKQPLSSVVYISFGSLVVLSSKQMENIAWGLKNSCRPFLWVVKPPEHAVKDRTGQLPLELLKEMDGQGLVVTWCPQAKVLSHPSIACFVTHCGWNSILETVASGLPVITYPQWTDQPTNAKLLVEVFEIGVRLKVGPDGVVGQDEVERCIADITEGPKAVGLKKKALYWKEAARAAVGVGGSSDRNIQVFVDDVIHRAREYLSLEVSTSLCPQGS